jgi:hypothetical protein
MLGCPKFQDLVESFEAVRFIHLLTSSIAAF